MQGLFRRCGGGEATACRFADRMRSLLVAVARPLWAAWGCEVLPIVVAEDSDLDATAVVTGAGPASGRGPEGVDVGRRSEHAEEQARRVKQAQLEEWVRANAARFTRRQMRAAVSQWVDDVREAFEADWTDAED